MRALSKIILLAFFACYSLFSHGQTTINTNHANNNGNGSVIFNVQNTNSYDISIIAIQCHLGTATINNIELLYRTSPYSDNSTPWSFGTVGAGQNGWISAGSGVVSNSYTGNGIVTALSSLYLTIPAGATYQLGLSATTMQYASLALGAGVNNFSADGVSILTGDGISWGGTVYPSTPANYPRGLIGGITFIPAGPHFAISAPATATAGAPFNFTVTALDAFNNTMTGYAGTVHFTSTDAAAALPADATLTNGVGTFSAILKTAGSQTIAATDTTTSATTGTSGVVAVSKKATTILLTASQTAVIAGSPMTLIATVASEQATGSVSFTDNGTPLPCSPVTLAPGSTSSTASCTASFTEVGVHSITATYLGNASFATATSSALAITAGTSGVTINSTPNPSLPGQEVTFSIAVSLDFTKSLQAQSGLAKAALVPTGTVTLTDGTTTLGTTTLDASGNATLTVKTLTTEGAHSIVASYSGDANFPPFQSAAFLQSVSAAPVATPTPTPVPSLHTLALVLLSGMAAGFGGLALHWRRKTAPA